MLRTATPSAAALGLPSAAALLLFANDAQVAAVSPVALSEKDGGCRRCTFTFSVSGDSRWLCTQLALRCGAVTAALLLLKVSKPLLLLSRPDDASGGEGRLPMPLPVTSVAARPPPVRALLMALRLVGLLGLCVCVM
jgi:hypothetical protein